MINQEIEFSEMLLRKAQQYINQLGIPLVEKFTVTWDNKKLERYTSF